MQWRRCDLRVAVGGVLRDEDRDVFSRHILNDGRRTGKVENEMFKELPFRSRQVIFSYWHETGHYIGTTGQCFGTKGKKNGTRLKKSLLSSSEKSIGFYQKLFGQIMEHDTISEQGIFFGQVFSAPNEKVRCFPISSQRIRPAHFLVVSS